MALRWFVLGCCVAACGGLVACSGSDVEPQGGAGGTPTAGQAAGGAAMSGAPASSGSGGVAAGTGGLPVSGGAGAATGGHGGASAGSGGAAAGGMHAGGSGSGGQAGGGQAGGGQAGGGQSGAGGGGPDNAAKCKEIKDKYAAELTSQTECSPSASAQCDDDVSAAPGCSCRVYMEPSDPFAIENLANIANGWYENDCEMPVCPAKCATAAAGKCQADSTSSLGGRCVTP